MKRILVGFAAMAALLSGCADTSSDAFQPSPSETTKPGDPEQYIVEKELQGLMTTLYCGPYSGPGTAKVRVVVPYPAEMTCIGYNDLMIKFLSSDNSKTGSGKGVVGDWECQAYGAVQAGEIGYAVECHKGGNHHAYLEIQKTSMHEPVMYN